MHHRKSLAAGQSRFSKFRSILLVAAVVASTGTSGCISTGDVRTYANESAKLTGYKKLAQVRADLYEVERAFANPSSELCNAKALKQQDEVRAARTPALLGYHETMSAYMAALAALAGETAYDFTKEMKAVSDAVSKLPSTGSDAKQFAAAQSLATLAANWAAEARQQRKIREVTSKAEPDVQVMLGGMGRLIEAQENDISVSKRCVASYLRDQGELARRRGSGLLSAMALDMHAEKQRFYAELLETAEKARAGIASVADGHTKLTKDAATLSEDDLKNFTGDIKKIKEAREALQQLGAI